MAGVNLPIRFLRLLPPDKLVLITIVELINMVGSSIFVDGFRTTRALLTIGKAIEAEHHFQTAKKDEFKVPDFSDRSGLPTYSVAGYLEMHKERVRTRLEMEGRENWMPPWTPEIRARVGAFVVDAVMESAKVVQIRQVEEEIL